ncbi:hypothetical protein M427DRAFT_153866 [Gonapodya prolifera JEL478]|uniref:RNA polymerase II subunit A C-terminal domain phosphatase n=1 Tax=Gonapodya prolifera (strain JEL478) TaxID=1344416 RepID=A0A139AKR0_GONPJ|nr:hypothetical protein M427DRAFT_153866 [Gonapodya prolifera JEL478]|eukprot:KXS17356.1 hypothetical protein M427DRAFT_153866 [Gonapodya prolifera JEL478]
METRRELFLPARHSPAMISRVLARAGQQVKPGQALFVYRRRGHNADEDGDDGVREEYQAPCEGVFDEIGVLEGERVDAKRCLAVIVEPCGHPTVFAGMCAVCGKDLETVFNRQTAAPPSATIAVDHNVVNLRVTKAEALRLERETTDRLLRSRKLSLVLDLDQTIIHATVDPTVDEWMRDPSNPNFPVLQGVHRFVLPDHPTVYYVKFRPNLQLFLEHISKLYELHIYTMGTRAYANEIAQKIDPEGVFFGERVLSRDESGSFTAKSLLRLFPFDQSMVAIVDDRADVWGWSQNLVKVRPYEFFLGIGDINSAVYEAAKKERPKTPRPAFTTLPPPSALIDPIPGLTLPDSEDADETEDTPEEKEQLLRRLSDAQAHNLEELASKRPLSSMMEMEDEDDLYKDRAGVAPSGDMVPDTTSPAPMQSETFSQSAKSAPTPPSPFHPPRRPVLRDDDSSLLHILEILTRLHTSFYEAYDRHVLTNPSTSSRRAGAKHVEPSPAPFADVRVILPAMRYHVLTGMTMAFSSLVPLGTDPKLNDFWRLADWFGGRVMDGLEYEVEEADVYEDGREPAGEIRSRSLGPGGDGSGVKRKMKVDCLVAGKKGTVKVADANAMGVPVVTKEWLLDSVYMYSRKSLRAYLLEPSEEIDERLDPAELSPRPLPLSLLPSPPVQDPDDGILASPTEHLFDNLRKEDWAEMDAEVDAELDSDDDDESILKDEDDRPSTSPGTKRPRDDDASVGESPRKGEYKRLKGSDKAPISSKVEAKGKMSGALKGWGFLSDLDKRATSGKGSDTTALQDVNSPSNESSDSVDMDTGSSEVGLRADNNRSNLSARTPRTDDSVSTSDTDTLSRFRGRSKKSALGQNAGQWETDSLDDFADMLEAELDD